MPFKHDHIRQAERNRQFWESHYSSGSPLLEWVVVGMFYEAVHWVEAYFANTDAHSKTHTIRNAALRLDPGLAAIVTAYEDLEEASTYARYVCAIYTEDQIRDSFIPLIDGIREHIAALL